jgi:hypothetical protein
LFLKSHFLKLSLYIHFPIIYTADINNLHFHFLKSQFETLNLFHYLSITFTFLLSIFSYILFYRCYNLFSLSLHITYEKKQITLKTTQHPNGSNFLSPDALSRSREVFHIFEIKSQLSFHISTVSILFVPIFSFHLHFSHITYEKILQTPKTAYLPDGSDFLSPDAFFCSGHTCMIMPIKS